MINSIINWFKKLPMAIWNAIKSIKQKFVDAFKGIGRIIASVIPDWIVKVLKGGISIGRSIGRILGFAQGGIVPGPIGKPTLAVVHGGETITPPGESKVFSPSITINATISSDYDVRRLAEELKRYWVSDFERASQGRSI